MSNSFIQFVKLAIKVSDLCDPYINDCCGSHIPMQSEIRVREKFKCFPTIILMSYC